MKKNVVLLMLRLSYSFTSQALELDGLAGVGAPSECAAVRQDKVGGRCAITNWEALEQHTHF